MLTELEITGFRCFPKLSAKPLGRVNLIVGKNNSGKTAFLDAVEILVSDGNVVAGLGRRSEFLQRIVEDPQTRTLSTQWDFYPANLFCGSQLRDGLAITLRAENHKVELHQRQRPVGIPAIIDVWVQSSQGPGWAMNLEPPDGAYRMRFNPAVTQAQQQTSVQYLPTWRWDLAQLLRIWDDVQATDYDQLVLEALRFIEARVEKLFPRGEGVNRHFWLKLKGDKQPQRLGTLGDGMRHILAIALHLVPAQKGYLLIDEIDSGLHFSVMAKMWRMVLETARRLDIQVFATTHSMDCIHALAEVHQQQRLTPDDLMLHRLEPELGKTISYTPDDLAAVAEFQGEVR